MKIHPTRLFGPTRLIGTWEYLHCVRRLSWSATYMATLLFIYISYMFLSIIHTLCEVIVKFIQELHYFRIISASPEKLILCQNTVIVSVNFAEEFFCFYLRVFLAQWNNFRWNSLIVEFHYSLINGRQLHIFSIEPKLDMGLFIDFCVSPGFFLNLPELNLKLFWTAEKNNFR